MRTGEIGRFEPTPQMCSVCGVKDGPKPCTSGRIGVHAICIDHKPTW